MSDLPNDLIEAIQKEVQAHKLPAIQKAVEELSSRYREAGARSEITAHAQAFMNTYLQKIAYLLVRMPATLSVVRKVLKEFLERMPNHDVSSIIDIGAGPGTVLWAASQEMPFISSLTCVEQDKELITLGKKLTSQSQDLFFGKIAWQHANASDLSDTPLGDLVIISYMVGELPVEKQMRLVEKSWKAAKTALIIIEPGTPHGFGRILQARNQLISLGAHIAAPCPHMTTCPLAVDGAWCHFPERLARSRDHRIVKQASLGYEDEKFSYMIASKKKTEEYQGRIVGHPKKHSGHLEVSICTKEGLKNPIVSKKQEFYKIARKLEWGSVINSNLILTPENK